MYKPICSSWPLILFSYELETEYQLCHVESKVQDNDKGGSASRNTLPLTVKFMMDLIPQSHSLPRHKSSLQSLRSASYSQAIHLPDMIHHLKVFLPRHAQQWHTERFPLRPILSLASLTSPPLSYRLTILQAEIRGSRQDGPHDARRGHRASDSSDTMTLPPLTIFMYINVCKNASLTLCQLTN